MRYNLKNKNAVILTLSFAVMMTMSNMAQAQEAAPVLFDETVAEGTEPQVAPQQADALAISKDSAEDTVKEESSAPIDTSFLDEQPVEETQGVLDAENESGAIEAENTEEDFLGSSEDSIEENQDEQAVAAPTSPFESFGNAILSKVDNDLFNQMSQIEKQTTLLNLELKREDVRNKVEALKAARLLAKQEAEKRRIEEEERLKDMELARQQKLYEAQEKVREKEIELEKVRQGKVLNEYMNEMLQMNQKWIEKNAVAQKRIQELQDERQGLISAFEEKIESVRQKTTLVNTHAKEAVEKYTETLKGLNSQIVQLRKDIVESEARIQMMKEQSSGNPFAKSNLDPSAASIDLAQEYAIMDITGQGDDIVAKIVSRDGTTFTVHRGSVLRGGETVIKITEKYIAFDKKGIKAYLYPGGTIMEYEPTNVFNEAEKTPEVTEKQSFRNEKTDVQPKEAAPVFGKPMNSEKKDSKKQPVKQEKPRQTNSLSFSQGMFAY